MSSILDFRELYFCTAYLLANNLKRISTIYLRGYWKGSENGRVVTIGSLFVLLYFFFWPLCCLFFFDLWILITPYASYSFSETICVMEQLTVLDLKSKMTTMVGQSLKWENRWASSQKVKTWLSPNNAWLSLDGHLESGYFSSKWIGNAKFATIAWQSLTLFLFELTWETYSLLQLSILYLRTYQWKWLVKEKSTGSCTSVSNCCLINWSLLIRGVMQIPVGLYFIS